LGEEGKGIKIGEKGEEVKREINPEAVSLFPFSPQSYRLASLQNRFSSLAFPGFFINPPVGS
jgi:hypothetical protein